MDDQMISQITLSTRIVPFVRTQINQALFSQILALKICVAERKHVYMFYFMFPRRPSVWLPCSYAMLQIRTTATAIRFTTLILMTLLKVERITLYFIKNPNTDLAPNI